MGLGIAIKAFFAALFDKQKAAQIGQVLSGQPALPIRVLSRGGADDQAGGGGDKTASRTRRCGHTVGHAATRGSVDRFDSRGLGSVFRCPGRFGGTALLDAVRRCARPAIRIAAAC